MAYLTELIVGPDERSCEEFRAELLALAEQAQNRAADAYTAERIDHGDIYTATARWIHEKLGGQS